MVLSVAFFFVGILSTESHLCFFLFFFFFFFFFFEWFVEKREPTTPSHPALSKKRFAGAVRKEVNFVPQPRTLFFFFFICHLCMVLLSIVHHCRRKMLLLFPAAATAPQRADDTSLKMRALGGLHCLGFSLGWGGAGVVCETIAGVLCRCCTYCR